MAKNSYNDFKDSLLGTFNFVAEKVLDLADTAADTAKSGHQIAKLLLDKRKEESAVDKAYNQLGKLYYDLYRDDAEGAFADLCADVETSLNNIRRMDEEIAALKDSIGADDPDIEVEFTEFFDDDEISDLESVVETAEAAADEPVPVPTETLDVPADEKAE